MAARGNGGRRSSCAQARHSDPDHHRFVNGIIILPNCRQARAKLECELMERCVGARSAGERRNSQPPSPPEFGADRAPLIQARATLTNIVPPPPAATDVLSRHRKANSLAGSSTSFRPLHRAAPPSVYWKLASVAPRIALGLSSVPRCTRTAASSMPSPLSVCSGMSHAWALPLQSPILIQRRATLW